MLFYSRRRKGEVVSSETGDRLTMMAKQISEILEKSRWSFKGK